MLVDNEVKRVAFYIRVSTDEQVKEGYGLDYQQDALEKLIEFRKNQFPEWTINKEKHIYIDDGYSGGDLNRPRYKDMMLAVKNREFDIVAVWKIDRMSRNLTHLLNVFEELQKFSVSFFSLKENIDFSGPVGRLTFQIFGALAEFEREMIKSRTSEGKRASARRGNYIGNGIPYGYERLESSNGEKGTKLKVVESEAKMLKQIFKRFVYDKYHYALISRTLDNLGIEKGIASKGVNKGTMWNQGTIKNMLRNTTYIGKRIERLKDEKGIIEEIEVSTPVIIDEDTFEYAQVRMEEIETEKGNKNGGGNNSYLLSRKIVDVDTKKCLVGYPRNENTYGYRRKKVTDEDTGIVHKNIDIPGDTIDSFVWKQLEIAINRPEIFFKLFKKQIDSSDDIDRLKEELDILINENKIINYQIENIDKDYYKGRIDEYKREKYIRDVENQRIKNEKRINELELKIDNLIKVMYSETVIKKVTEKFKKNIDNLNLEQRQIIVDILVDKIYVKKEDDKKLKIKIMFKFDPNKIEKGIGKDELKNSTNTVKSNDAINVSNVNGRRRETRTHNPTLPKRVR